MPEFMSTKQLSEQLSVAEGTIRDWVYRRRIPFHKINGLVRFDVAEIRNWIAGQSERAQ